MQQPDRGVKRNNDDNLAETAGQNITGQDLFEMFGALPRTGDYIALFDANVEALISAAAKR